VTRWRRTAVDAGAVSKIAADRPCREGAAPLFVRDSGGIPGRSNGGSLKKALFPWGDRGFESCSLQRGVSCEPDVLVLLARILAHPDTLESQRFRPCSRTSCHSDQDHRRLHAVEGAVSVPLKKAKARLWASNTLSVHHRLVAG
jgi:hypothetical protein